MGLRKIADLKFSTTPPISPVLVVLPTIYFLSAYLWRKVETGTQDSLWLSARPMMLICTRSRIQRQHGRVFQEGGACPPSTGCASSSTTNFFSASICAKLPSLCMFIRISHPPTNSLSMYN